MSSGKASFFFFKYSLIFLNIFFLIVAVILIAVAAAAKASSQFSSLTILGGIIASGVFLMLLSFIGFFGAVKHHQVCLFFYMVFLGILFIILFSVSIAALALNESQRHALLEKAWGKSSNTTKMEIQKFFDCCGFVNATRALNDSGDPSCVQSENLDLTPTCANLREDTCKVYNKHYESPCCAPCYSSWQESIEKALRMTGGVGLFFSFSEVFGMVFTYYYRNRKDPTINPRAFL